MSQLDDLKTAIKSHLGELECVIGWERGYDRFTPRRSSSAPRRIWTG
jgi:hypothetical protein